MNVRRLALLAPLALALALACRTLAPRPASPADELADWLCGSFSSAAQAARHNDFYDIRLHTTRIWKARDDGPWLYVEQAAASALETPYRQRVYHLVGTERGLRSDVYELPGNPLDWAGAWDRPQDFETLTPGDLSERSGCALQLERRAGAWVGSTNGTGCASQLRGATYATSEVRVTPGLLTSWDRGFDADGNQVWGATARPYEFVRLGRP